MSGVLATESGKVVGPLETAHSILDDGSGNATIGGSATVAGALTAGTTVGAEVDAFLASGGGQSFHVQPLAGADAYNVIVESGDVVVVGAGSVQGGAPLALVPWSATKGGLRLLPSGDVLSAANTLDDGAGNATIAGSLSAGTTTVTGAYPFILYSGGLGAETLSSGALGTWYSGVGVQASVTAASNIAAFAVVSSDGVKAINITTAGNATLAGSLQLGGAVTIAGAQSGSTLDLSGNATVGGALSVGGAQSGSTLDLSGNATVGGALSVTGAQSGSTLSLSGNATIAGALTSNIAIPGGNSVALTNAISQLSVNVNNFSSPQDAVNYVVSQGGGEVLFPASATEYAGFGTNSPYNLRIVGQGFGSRISGAVNLYNTPSYTTSAATSSADTITLTSVSGLEVGFYLQSYGLPSGNTIPPSTYITAIDTSTDTITVNNSVTLTSGTSIAVINPNFPSSNIQIENICLNNFGGGGLNNIEFRNVYFLNSNSASDTIYINVVQNLRIINCFFATTSSNSNQHIWIDNTFGASVLSKNILIDNNTVLTNEFHSGSYSSYMAKFLYAVDVSTATITGNKCDWGFYGSGANAPMSFAILSGQCQGWIFTKNFMSGISSFLTLNSKAENSTTFMPSYIDIVDDNQVDVFVDTLINVTSSSSPAAYITVDGNSFDNPMYYVTGISSIVAGGSGYVVGDVVTLGSSLSGAEGFSAQASVTSVSSGAITGLSMTVQGAYPAPLSNPVAVSGGSGTGATVDLNWSGNPQVAWFNNTYLAQFTNNRLFSYGGYNPAAAAVVFNGCYATRFNGNSVETFVNPVQYQGSAFNEIRGNLLSGLPWGSGMDSGTPPNGSVGIVIYGGGSYATSDNFQIGENDIFGFDFAGNVFDGTSNNTGVLYINILGDNVVGNITNISQFFYNGNSSGNTWTASLNYEEHWSPATFQQDVTFNGAEWATSSNTIPTFGQTLNILGVTHQFQPTVTVSASGGTTLTASDLINNTVLSRTGLTANSTDTTDTAANIIAAFTNSTTGISNVILLSNYTSYDWTIAGGSGVSTSGTMTIPPGMAAKAYIYISSSTVDFFINEFVSIGGAWNSGSSQITTTSLGVSGNATISGSTYLDGTVVGSPSIQSEPSVSVGTWVQNTSGGPLWLCLPVILGSSASANLYAASVSGSTSGVDLCNIENGNSADIVASLVGLIPAGWWWAVSASGTYTVNSSSYPNGAMRVI